MAAELKEMPQTENCDSTWKKMRKYVQKKRDGRRKKKYHNNNATPRHMAVLQSDGFKVFIMYTRLI